jgi:muramoyltetrapeptide carboxypeptidase LdcA involved in peptidoglycan recycling
MVFDVVLPPPVRPGDRVAVVSPSWCGRAEDLIRAFEDDSISAVMATIGGDDQITVLRHLDPTRMLAHPKRFLALTAPALLWARPPVSSREQPRTEAEAAELRAERRDAVLRAVADCNPGLVVVLDVDFGHTSPQLLLPYGGRVTVDGEQQVITAHFG